jgi:hypothetical protein
VSPDERAAEPADEPEAQVEPAAVDGGSAAEPEAEPRRRFWRRRPDAEEEAAAAGAAGWRKDSGRGDPWEAGAEAGEVTGDDTAVGLDEPLVTAPPPPRGLLRRGRR